MVRKWEIMVPLWNNSVWQEGMQWETVGNTDWGQRTKLGFCRQQGNTEQWWGVGFCETHLVTGYTLDHKWGGTEAEQGKWREEWSVRESTEEQGHRLEMQHRQEGFRGDGKVLGLDVRTCSVEKQWSIWGCRSRRWSQDYQTNGQGLKADTFVRVVGQGLELKEKNTGKSRKTKS